MGISLCNFLEVHDNNMMYSHWRNVISCFIYFQSIGNVQREYEKMVVQFSIKNQLRYKGNLGE